MDLHLPTTPRFSVGRELASLITSCGILQKAWEEICTVCKNNLDFFLKEDEGVAYVTFPSFSTEDFIVTDSRFGEYSIKNERIFSPHLRGDNDKPALVHKGAFTLFKRIRESEDFIAKMKGLKARTIIFGGHSMGGAVATLITLSFLQKEEREKSYFCITFGSPLVGNAILGEAIGRKDWTGKFCHVVAKYDIVPRMLLAPFDSTAKPFNEIMRGSTDSVVVTHPSIPNPRKTLLQKVLQGISTIVEKSGESGITSPYRPFGTYLFCSTQGAACIDDPEAVLQMLHLTVKGLPFNELPETCASDHTDYGPMLEAITNHLLNATSFENAATDSFETGVVLELEAIGVGAQSHAYDELRKAGERKNEQDMNIEKLNENLSEMQSSMAQVEWYKARCQKDSGYYDSFKGTWEKREHKVNLAREKLDGFWDEIVEKEEKHVLPSGFRWQNKWINAGTAYRRLVEPLHIAFHYTKSIHKDTKSYLSDEVRSHHHTVLEKWMKEKEQTRVPRDKKNDRTMFASLTLDSCFWARLEEARKALRSPPQEKRQDQIQKFEDYIWNMIEQKTISAEVFLTGSSFMFWWEQYSRYLRNQSPESTSSSHLFSFMKREEWKTTAQ